MNWLIALWRHWRTPERRTPRWSEAALAGLIITLRPYNRRHW